MGESNPSLVEPLIGLLQSLHIEVQYEGEEYLRIKKRVHFKKLFILLYFLNNEAIELITLLMEYSVKESIIKSLVNVLKPPKRIETTRPETSESELVLN